MKKILYRVSLVSIVIIVQFVFIPFHLFITIILFLIKWSEWITKELQPIITDIKKL